MNYVDMDTSNIVLWISVCVRNMSVTKKLCFGSILKLYRELITVSFSM